MPIKRMEPASGHHEQAWRHLFAGLRGRVHRALERAGSWRAQGPRLEWERTNSQNIKVPPQYSEGG
jgi:hypothetical protein